jgi:16S rRNA (guanine527-N7)-methyltransferase
MAGIATITGRSTTSGDRRLFERYLAIFLQWNRTHRMTALTSPSAIVRELFLHSLLFRGLLPPGPIKLLDIGAGSGIPGLPIRLADPQVALTFVEARRKRVSFLRAACRALELEDVVIREGRAEALATEPMLSEVFDAVVARSVGPPERLVPMAMGYLKAGGVVVISGPPRPATAGGPVQAIQVPIPGSSSTRLFLRAMKQDIVPRGT